MSETIHIPKCFFTNFETVKKSSTKILFFSGIRHFVKHFFTTFPDIISISKIVQNLCNNLTELPAGAETIYYKFIVHNHFNYFATTREVLLLMIENVQK